MMEPSPTGRYALIVAGGKGLRMGSSIPKQFLEISGRPVLMRTLERFHAWDPLMRLVLVLPLEHQAYWRSLVLTHAFDIVHEVAEGGTTRFESVRNGLALLPQEGLVAVHDGVRPFVSDRVIEACFREAERTGAAIPVLPLQESLRRLLPGGVSTAQDRASFRLVQTPQTFRMSLLKKAYLQPYDPRFTDDASLVEALGHPVSLVEGNRENIKLTTPMDMLLASCLT